MSVADRHALETRVAAAWPTSQWCDTHAVLAVSGGPDSVAMLCAVRALKKSAGGRGELLAAHFNHRQRGSDSDADQSWVESLCRRLKVPIEIGAGDVAALAAAQGDGWEAAARDARYEFLRLVAEKRGARCVVVAHTADDQAETVLHRILRGSGLAGLAGMPGVRSLSPSVALVRPLLNVTRREVIHYLEAIGQDFRVDASNADPRWTRNRLRHELLPLLRRNYNTEVDESLRRLATQAAEAQQVVANLAAKLVEQHVAIEPTAQGSVRVRVDCRALRPQPPALVREACKLAWSAAGWPLGAMGFDEWQQLAEMIGGEGCPSPINLPGNVRADRRGDLLILELGNHS